MEKVNIQHQPMYRRVQHNINFWQKRLNREPQLLFGKRNSLLERAQFLDHEYESYVSGLPRRP